MNWTYLTPKETASVLNTDSGQCANLGLILGRYVPQEVIENQDKPNGRRGEKHREPWLREQCERFNKDGGAHKAVKALAQARYDRWKARTEDCIRWKMVLKSRLIIGLGGKGALEIGITLDHVTGLPVIPGSALKGVARSYFLLRIAKSNKLALDPADPQAMNEALNELESQLTAEVSQHQHAHLFRQAFGALGQAGALIFHDAVLVPRFSELFAVDVMTPHFSKYYRSTGGAAPGDDDSPNPVSFVTVAADVQFAFAVGLRAGAPADSIDLGWAYTALSRAIPALGIGSKTAAGYGWLEVVE